MHGLYRSMLTMAVLLAGAHAATAQPPAKHLTIRVDATDAARRFLKANLEIPAVPGKLTLYYPKWIPGEHGPTGPITDLAGLKITASGHEIPWQRDEVDMYAFHCQVPQGANSVHVALNFLSPGVAAGFSSGASLTPHLGVINWNQIVLYPKGTPARDLVCAASIRLPDGWQLGTALAVASRKGNETTFAPVSLESLVDAPVICGQYFKEVPIGPSDGPHHYLLLAADGPAPLEYTPAFKKNMDQLIVEAGKLFGTRHYKSYRFLLSLSDQVAHFGLEHHECSDNRGPEGLLVSDRIKKTNWAQLLPHEYVHSWNGKYRRPADMVTKTFQEPQRTKLLWVYEGLTQYLGAVLTARSGLWSDEQFRDGLAHVGSWAQNQRGRTWRPLEDTTVAAQLLYYARGDWAAWRRGTDFYDEGILLWLDIDTLIRAKTDNAKSLDDFCRRFFGGKGGAVALDPYTLDDLIAGLNAIVPHDWQALIHQRLTATGPEAPLEGIRRGGWKLAYTDKATSLMKETEGENKIVDATASLGLMLREDGTVSDVVPGKVAHQAGIGPGMKVVAVNSRRWSGKGLHTALAASKKVGKVDLIVEQGELIQALSLPYGEGERFPRLEREHGMPDLIEAITRPLSPSN